MNSLAARSERGGGSMLMIGVMCVLMMLGLVSICVAGFLVAGHRARSAADLAALTGATAFTRGGDSCDAARNNARANEARLVSCRQSGDGVEFVVSVRVGIPVQVSAPGLPKEVIQTAHAGSVNLSGGSATQQATR